MGRTRNCVVVLVMAVALTTCDGQSARERTTTSESTPPAEETRATTPARS